MEPRNGKNESISCITKVIKVFEYIQFQLTDVTKQLINVHNVFLHTFSRINCIEHICTEECWTQCDLFIVRELGLSI